MSENTPAPTGLGRRRRRLSDQETERRMLDAALATVNRTGLTVSLEHISFEDVIKDAGVARSAVYRRWPYKDLFFSDLLKELAGEASPAIAGTNPEAVEAVNRTFIEHTDWLETPELRMALVAEVMRQGAQSEFATFYASPEWRTYFTLHATFLSLPDGELRDEVRKELTDSERLLIEGVAWSYRRVSELLGLRLRPGAGITYETVARIATAAVRGLILMAPSNPGITEHRMVGDPFDAPEPAEWTEPALAMATAVLSFLEPDPEVPWNEARTAAVRRTLTSGEWARRSS